MTTPIVAQLLSTIGVLGEGVAPVSERYSRYSEKYVIDPWVSPQVIALDGAYYTVTNPTIGTAIAAAVLTAFDATKAHFQFANGAATGGVFVIPDYIKMVCTAAPASATVMHYAIQVDPSGYSN